MRRSAASDAHTESSSAVALDGGARVQLDVNGTFFCDEELAKACVVSDGSLLQIHRLRVGAQLRRYMLGTSSLKNIKPRQKGCRILQFTALSCLNYLAHSLALSSLDFSSSTTLAQHVRPHLQHLRLLLPRPHADGLRYSHPVRGNARRSRWPVQHWLPGVLQHSPAGPSSTVLSNCIARTTRLIIFSKLLLLC